MKTKLTLLLGGAVGYVLGAKAGRQRYEQIQRAASRVTQRPEVQHARDVAAARANQVAGAARDAVGDKVTTAVQDGQHRVSDALGDRMPERLRPHHTGSPAPTAATPVGMVPGSGSSTGPGPGPTPATTNGDAPAKPSG